MSSKSCLDLYSFSVRPLDYLRPCKLQTSMLSVTGRPELASITEVCLVQLRLCLLPALVGQTDFESAHQVGGDGGADRGTVQTEPIIGIIMITITVTIISNVDVDKVILRLYEGLKGDHLEV